MNIALTKHFEELIARLVASGRYNSPNEVIRAGLRILDAEEKALTAETFPRGPLLDRVDLHIEVPAVKFREMTAERTGESSAQIRERVIVARQRQTARFAAKPRVTCNARMGSEEIEAHCEIDETTLELLKMAMTQYNLSARAYDRILKVARTIADLAGSERIVAEHIQEAVSFRSLDRQIWG